MAPMQRSLKLNPNQAPGWHALGVTYIQLNKNPEAVGAISKAIRRLELTTERLRP